MLPDPVDVMLCLCYEILFLVALLLNVLLKQNSADYSRIVCKRLLNHITSSPGSGTVASARYFFRWREQLLEEHSSRWKTLGPNDLDFTTLGQSKLLLLFY